LGWKDKNMNEIIDEIKPPKNDPQVLRAKGGDSPTDPIGLSQSIIHVLKEFDHVKVLSVGPTALNSVMAAFRIASIEVTTHTNGSVLVCRQSEYTAEINGKKAKGVSTRIFAIDIKYAL
jgi:hypothetical protein